jgi:hypothetical protein
MLTDEDRARVVADLRRLRLQFPKLEMPNGLLDAYIKPPDSPDDCIFAQTTECLSADLKTKITPCQFGGKPDCASCGCIASAGLTAVGRHKLPGGLRVGAIYWSSRRVGQVVSRWRGGASPPPSVPQTAPGV